MAFDSLSDRLQGALKKVTGKGKLNEKDIENMMREVRLSLLEADVNYKVVKQFTNEVKEKALGEKVLKSLSPGQQVVKIVHEELKQLMGEDAHGVAFKGHGTTVIMLVGLQGAGKTTHAGKLANYMRKKHNKKPLMVAADIYRPAAIDQLETVGKQLNVPVFSMGTDVSPVEIAKKALQQATENKNDLVIIDTAGRLHIDEALMDELQQVKEIAKPDEILLTVDAMTGQDAVTVADSFHKQLNVTGAILTKLDGDTRGGAALSIRKVTGVPIKFMGLGEQLDKIEVFHPERMASRILGMGDVLTLIEKAQDAIDEEEAMDMAKKFKEATFDYNDFKKQIKQIKRLGNLKGIMKMIPGMGKQLNNVDIDDKQFNYIEAIINSMTKEERRNPNLMSSSRRRRIAEGAGRNISEVNRIIKQFEEMRKMMKKMMNMDERQMSRMMNNQGGAGGGLPGMAPKPKKGKGKGKGRGRRPF
ncbi:signal recognition particle protein [Haloplasma contractile]|uniref:Signal recognition particle protein n=1 Tax=Haloplasma contractile SSD-17B TaxID=1033810 RepID=U2EFK9_9MOLU|nr:signal recognition particle protein [Haloplasma contractile]ERJ13441.1 Signal recognition particle protein [Haloplasma contractile SSD-17B]